MLKLTQKFNICLSYCNTYIKFYTNFSTAYKFTKVSYKFYILRGYKSNYMDNRDAFVKIFLSLYLRMFRSSRVDFADFVVISDIFRQIAMSSLFSILDIAPYLRRCAKYKISSNETLLCGYIWIYIRRTREDY